MNRCCTEPEPHATPPTAIPSNSLYLYLEIDKIEALLLIALIKFQKKSLLVA